MGRVAQTWIFNSQAWFNVTMVSVKQWKQSMVRLSWSRLFPSWSCMHLCLYRCGKLFFQINDKLHQLQFNGLFENYSCRVMCDLLQLYVTISESIYEAWDLYIALEVKCWMKNMWRDCKIVDPATYISTGKKQVLWKVSPMVILTNEKIYLFYKIRVVSWLYWSRFNARQDMKRYFSQLFYRTHLQHIFEITFRAWLDTNSFVYQD